MELLTEKNLDDVSLVINKSPYFRDINYPNGYKFRELEINTIFKTHCGLIAVVAIVFDEKGEHYGKYIKYETITGKLNNHRLKHGGFKLTTESRDTRRLNDVS